MDNDKKLINIENGLGVLHTNIFNDPTIKVGVSKPTLGDEAKRRVEQSKFWMLCNPVKPK